MCGIAGIVGRHPAVLPPSPETLARMAGALRHRGPDEFGVYHDRQAGLAHARLAIIDLATGQQPLANEDRSVWIVFNGEIFNYVELREELRALGHHFRTGSDTEVIVHAFEAWGSDAFRRFNGQFACALWDRHRRSLTLARDPVGICPLYVAETADRVFFASEIKALFAAAPELSREFDPVGLTQVFTFWTVVPPRTAFAAVHQLPPGHCRTYGPREVTESSFAEPGYPSAADPGFRGSPEEAAEAVGAALRQATRLRMLRADVPVGSYLSGGLDSSLVASLGLAAQGRSFKTYSLRFADAEFDEGPYQSEMARRLGSEHHETRVTRRDIADVFPDVVRHAEQPILRTAPAPLFLLSRLVRADGIKVVLTGEGADEMFAGYDLFREAKIRRFWARNPRSAWRPLLLGRLYPYLARSPVAQLAVARQFFGRNLENARLPGFSHDLRWHGTAALQRFFRPDRIPPLPTPQVRESLLADLPAAFSTWSSLAQDQYLEIRTLLSGYLLSAQGDRMLLANSVEGRFPFLDPDVIALAQSLPPRHLLPGLDEKHVLKRVAHGLLPESILRRPKQPYRAPDAASFLAPDAPDYVGDCLSPAALAEVGVFDVAAVTGLWNKCRRRSGDTPFSNSDNMAIVGILSTQLLHHALVRRNPAIPPPPLTTCVYVDA